MGENIADNGGLREAFGVSDVIDEFCKFDAAFTDIPRATCDQTCFEVTIATGAVHFYHRPEIKPKSCSQKSHSHDWKSRSTCA